MENVLFCPFLFILRPNSDTNKPHERKKPPSKIMKRARTDDEPIEGGDGGKILLISYSSEGADVYSLDSVTPLVYSYLQTANDKDAEYAATEEAKRFPLLDESLHYIWRAIGYSCDDSYLDGLPPELRESTKKVDFRAWKKYKTTLDEVNADGKRMISAVFTLNCCDI